MRQASGAGKHARRLLRAKFVACPGEGQACLIAILRKSHFNSERTQRANQRALGRVENIMKLHGLTPGVFCVDG